MASNITVSVDGLTVTFNLPACEDDSEVHNVRAVIKQDAGQAHVGNPVAGSFDVRLTKSGGTYSEHMIGTADISHIHLMPGVAYYISCGLWTSPNFTRQR